ncbi:unnamed protein product [Caenorhabditis angaria]|uniref:AB hydrolase-1 domain-containing protein n=1 Tax=Caenorhabditis angaria TaxID=860376 RepID=A0A9P1I534_9PELO|nr:unnamed protein product [Caenorhabditis angaria]
MNKKNFKNERKTRATAGAVCGSEMHIASQTFKLNDNTISSVNPEDYAEIVSNLQSAVCLNVARRVACPAHDSKLWSDLPNKKLTFAKVMSKILFVLMSFIYIFLPPWPPKMFRKIVFCHPQQGKYYYLIGESNGKKKACFKASETIGMDHLSICLPQMIKPKVRAVDVFYHLLRCKVFTLPFNEKQKLICAMELYCEQSIRWLHRDKNRTKIRSPNLIIFSQPNSSDLGCCLMMDPNFADIADFLQCDLLIFDYPGYGISEGKTNEKNVYAAIDTVMKYAMNTLGYKADKIILIGFSLGTAAMVHLAEQFKVAALILIAPFTSFLRIATRKPTIIKPWFDMFPSLEKSKKIQSPTLICHGEKDFIVGHNHGVKLQATIPNSEIYLLQHANHQGIFCERDMWDHVEDFLGRRVGITKNWIEHMQQESTFSEVSEAFHEEMNSKKTKMSE